MGRAATSERTRCCIGAKIVFNDGLSSIDCIIRNMSASGARLEVDGSIAVPQDFELEMPSQGVTRRVSARWRDVNAVGIEFIPEDEESPWNNALAAENCALRAQLELLTLQLRGQAHA